MSLTDSLTETGCKIRAELYKKGETSYRDMGTSMTMTTMMVMTTTTTMRMTTTMTTMTTRVTQHWDLIEARGFHKDTKDIRNNNVDDGEDVEDNDNNDEKNNTIPNQT